MDHRDAMKRLLWWMVVCSGLAAAQTRADVRLAPIFADGAILQRDQPLVIWGTAESGERVRVEFKGRVGETQAGADGAWRVTLPAVGVAGEGSEGSEGSELVVTGNSRVVCRDVLLGDVWWCSGQSNMEFTVASAKDGAREVATANFPRIRQIKIGRMLADAPREDFTATGWKAAMPAAVGHFTAAGYFFAREVQARTGVPIGIVNCTWSGTAIEPWMSAEALAGDAAFAVVGERWRADLAAYPARRAAFEKTLEAWRTREAAAKAEGEAAHARFLRENRAPRPPTGAPDHPYPANPSAIFNGMVHPLRGLGIKGVLWYQGEANAVRAPEYAALFQAQIRDWRRFFGQAELPFYWVQIANFRVETDWPRLREAQSRALALPHTGQAVAIDIGDPDDIHPTNKQEVGRRLALIALAKVYGGSGKTEEFSGPVVRMARRVGAGLEIQFDHAAGLVARGGGNGGSGAGTRGGARSLEIAGENRVFHPAEGRIRGDTLIVAAVGVAEPVAVRYAWRSAPEADLFNGAGLPAGPFRTDDW
jgi:sialate O-acetylesterase